MFSKKVKIVILLACLTASLNVFAEDSMNLSSSPDSRNVGPQSVRNTQPVMSATNDCRDASNIKSVIVGGTGGTWGWKDSACPTGYVPKALKSYVGMGFNSGEWNWQVQCCRTVVTYQ